MKKSYKLLLLLSITIIYNSLTVAAPNLQKEKNIVPDNISGVETIDAKGVIEKVTTITNQIIIDARIKSDRVHGYLENSISLPDINTNCSTLKDIVSDKATPIIFYCNGIKCGRSVVSIKVAKSCGYKNLSWFKGGFADWKNSGYQFKKDRQF